MTLKAWNIDISFNSIKVRLILHTSDYFVSKRICFNSIKVRLIPDGSNGDTKSRLFQFHKGSINTYIGCKASLPLSSFNSIKVRLIQTFLAL